MSILSIILVGLIFLSIQYEPAFAASSTVIIPEGHMYWASCEKFKECFQPAVVTVNIGDEVVWQNQDSVTHTITSGYSSKGHDGNFDLIVKIGHSEKVRFDKPGIYPYFCIVHPWTEGKIVVNDIKVHSISMNVSPSSTCPATRLYFPSSYPVLNLRWSRVFLSLTRIIYDAGTILLRLSFGIM